MSEPRIPQRRAGRTAALRAAARPSASKLGFAILVAGFLAYVMGWLPAHVPVEQLPQLWTLPLAEYLARDRHPDRLGLARAPRTRASSPGLVGIVILAGCSLLCLLADHSRLRARAATGSTRRSASPRSPVLLLAASGVLTPGTLTAPP